MRLRGHQPGYPVFCATLVLMAWAVVGHRAAASPAALADKPDDPGFVLTRAVFDCTPRQTIAVAPGLATSLADSTYGTGNVDGYACRPWQETGPEAFYTLDVTGEVDLFVALRNLGDLDLDLFLLSACDNDSCLVGANIEFTTHLQPGTYTLVVDGYAQPQPQAGPFTLEMSAREPGLPDGVCGGPNTVPVTCEAGTVTLDGDLDGLPDLVRTNDCSLNIAQSGEQWYAITVTAYHEFTATTTSVPAAMDPVLWLFPGCGQEIQCLDSVDDKVAGERETLTWANASFLDTTVYLGVDAFLPPANVGDGVFTLEISCQAMVGTENSSFGSLKALFR